MDHMEHPFTRGDFNQSTVWQIYNNTIANSYLGKVKYKRAYLYFTSGKYNAYYKVKDKYFPVEIYPGESLWGRMGANKGYQEPATETKRPLFIGGFKLDSNTSINNLILHNNYAITNFETGITMDNATNVSINDSQVGIDISGAAGYHTAISMNNSSLTISRSDAYGYSKVHPKFPDDPNAFGVGLKVTNGGNVTTNKGSIIQGYSKYGDGIGLYVAPITSPNGDVTSKIGIIRGDSTSKFIGIGGYNGYGLYATTFQNVSLLATVYIGGIINSKFIGIAESRGNAYGLAAYAESSVGVAKIHIPKISNSNFSGTAEHGGYGYGLNASSFSNGNEADVKIDDIDGSTFSGASESKAKIAHSYGFVAYAKSSELAHISLGSITESTFGNIHGSDVGFFAESSGKTTDIIIKTIEHNIFSATKLDVGLHGGNIVVAKKPITAGSQLYSYLFNNQRNTFVFNLDPAVCVNNDCV